MAVARARAELRDLPPNATWQEKEIEFRKMFTRFKKSCTEAGILHTYKQHEYYESPGSKKRRKKREAEVQRLKSMLRENFPEKKRRERE